MNTAQVIESLPYILPELSVSVSLILIVLFDLISPANKKYIPVIAGLGILAAGIFTASHFGESASVHFYGMYTVDSLGTFFKLLLLLASALVIIFSLSSQEITDNYDRAGEFYTLVTSMLLGMMFLVSASDLILVYFSVELLSLSSYILAGFVKLRERSSEAALKYILYGAAASGIMLFGISILFGLTGTTNLDAVNTVLTTENLNYITLLFSGLLILGGIGFKMAAAPFHFWSPDVYEGAPITITAYLAVASKVAGFAILIRFITIGFVTETTNGMWELVSSFDWVPILAVLSVLSMTIGNLSALWQSNLKRMLAYSSIAHAGYILLGLVVLTGSGLSSMLVYFVIYLFMNLGAFYCVMLIADNLGSEDIHDINGLGYASPFLSVALVIFLISLTGLPPTGGFIAKLYVFLAVAESGMVWLLVIALINTVISLYYYARVLKHLFLKKAENEHLIDVSPYSIVFISLLLIPTLLFGIYFEPLIDLANYVVSSLSI